MMNEPTIKKQGPVHSKVQQQQQQHQRIRVGDEETGWEQNQNVSAQRSQAYWIWKSHKEHETQREEIRI